MKLDRFVKKNQAGKDLSKDARAVSLQPPRSERNKSPD